MYLATFRSRYSWFAIAVFLASLNHGCRGDIAEEGEAVRAAAAREVLDLSKPDIIDRHVVITDQGVDEAEAGVGACRHFGVFYRNRQLLHSTVSCFKVLCSAGELHWVADHACCPSDAGLQPETTRQPTDDPCQLRVCEAGRWTLVPDFERCCQHGDQWFPIGSSRPMRGGPCTYQLCHDGRWEEHYNTTCCFDEIGWHTTGTVLFTADPCHTKTCRNARWTERDTCCQEPGTGRHVASGDILRVDACTYQLCRESTWRRHVAFSCCQRRGYQYENGVVMNIGSACMRDRCVDGSWHVVRREHVSRDRCTAGWKRLGHRCVSRMESSTWHEGEERCQKEEGTLLSVATKAGWSDLAKVKGNTTSWLGLKGYEVAEGVTEWRWLDGTPRSVPILWAAHEPRALPGHVCAYVLHGRAHSCSCDERHLVLCETTHCEH